MLLKIKSDGTVLYSIPESINQSSNLVNSVQVIAPFSKTLTADIAFQLPQGTITEPVLMAPREFSSDNTFNLWTISIDKTITQYSGTVYFTIRFYTASEDENPPILATVRSSFPINKAVLPSLPLEPTTETYMNVLSHINDLYLTKVDRFDILDLPEGIDYTENGLKTSSALFTNATFTVSTTVYNGSLLVFANETTSDDITTRIQTELLFAEDIILRRMITIVDSVVTVGDWKNYLDEIDEAVSTHNTSLTAHEDIRTAISDEATARENADVILQENIDAVKAAGVSSYNGRVGDVVGVKSDVGLGNVDNTSDLNKPFSTATQTELDKKVDIEKEEELVLIPDFYKTTKKTVITNGGSFSVDTRTLTEMTGHNDISTVTQFAQSDFLQLESLFQEETDVPNEEKFKTSGSIVITPSFLDTSMVFIARTYSINTIEHPVNSAMQIQKGSISLNVRDGKSAISTEVNYPEENVNDLLLTKTNFTRNGNEILDTSTGLTLASQTLTSEQKTQVKTNLGLTSIYVYKGSVDTYEDLPTEDILVGDIYNVVDTGKNYAWTGTEWDDIGGTVDLSNYLAKDNSTSYTPSGDYNPATKKYADDSLALKENLLPTTPTLTIYVDKNRQDTYVEDGTIFKPFKTIASAIACVVSLNSDSYINIEINNGIYAETIALENTALKYIVLTGKGYVSINPSSGNALQSTSNNNNLFALHIDNIIFSKPIVLTGSNGTTAFTDVLFHNVKFNGTGTITATCINNITFKCCYDECNIVFNNVNYCCAENTQLQGDYAIINDSSSNTPSQGANHTTMGNALTLLGSPTYSASGTSTITLALTSSRWGINSPVTISSNVIIYAYSTFLRGTHTNNGAITLRSGSTMEGYVAGTGTLTITGNDGKFQYYDNTESGLTATNLSSAINEVADNQLELGETSTTAYAGDKGKTAYDHSQLTSGNPHSVSKSDVGLGNVVNPNIYGNIAESDNLDNIVYTGFYTCNGTATGAPSTDYSWFVVHLNSGIGTTYAKQIAFADDGIQYERFKNTTWSDWKQRIQVISGFDIAVEDFQENLTYSRFPYRASVDISGITSADHCKAYFTMANINSALDTETTFQVSSYNGGIHIYATDLPTGTLTVEDIEVVRG